MWELMFYRKGSQTFKEELHVETDHIDKKMHESVSFVKTGLI